MTRNWPAKLNPSSLAEQEFTVNGAVSVIDMPRVRSITSRDDTEIRARLKFYLHSSGLPAVQGQIEGQLELRCERCLSNMLYSIDDHFDLVLLEQGEHIAENLLESLETAEYTDVIEPISLLEDQIILALPLVIKHARLQDCDPVVKKWMHDKAEFEKQIEKPNPFAILKNLDP